MFLAVKEKRFNTLLRGIAVAVVAALLTTSIIPPQRAYAQNLDLPTPGTMVQLTGQFQPPIIKGIKVDPDNPLLFNFLIDPGDLVLSQNDQKIEYRKLIKYFLAALTTPEKDMWVNLSPYEHNRMISNDLGQTEMGRDMLAQDYILKQLTASLVYPEKSLGKKFWDEVYERVRMETGSTANIPVNTFNKVWIIPESATVFEKGNVAIVVASHMKVLLDQDYLSLSKHTNVNKDFSRTSSDVVRQIILPAIEKEVNTGRNFANIRQIYNSMILASWFKQRLTMDLLSKVYVNKNENAGVMLQNPEDNEYIYKDYLKAFKKGVFNYIKEDTDNGQVVPRKYFSGGENYAMLADPKFITKTSDPASVAGIADRELESVSVLLDPAQASTSAANNPQDAFNKLLSLANAGESSEQEKISAKDIKRMAKNGLATWGGNSQDIVKVIKYLVNIYYQEPKVQAKKNVAFSISTNIWYDLHFHSALSGLSNTQSQAFADALRTELEKVKVDQPAGSILYKVYQQLGTRVKNTQSRYEEALKNPTVARWWIENKGAIQTLPVQVDEDALVAADTAYLKQQGVSDPEARLEAKEAGKVFQLGVEFLQQDSVEPLRMATETRTVQLAEAVEADNIVLKKEDVASDPINFGSTFTKVPRLRRYLLQKLAIAALFVVVATFFAVTIFAANNSSDQDELARLKSQLSSAKLGYFLTPEGQKKRAREKELENQLKSQVTKTTVTPSPVAPAVKAPIPSTTVKASTPARTVKVPAVATIQPAKKPIPLMLNGFAPKLGMYLSEIEAGGLHPTASSGDNKAKPLSVFNGAKELKVGQPFAVAHFSIADNQVNTDIVVNPDRIGDAVIGSYEYLEIFPRGMNGSVITNMPPIVITSPNDIKYVTTPLPVVSTPTVAEATPSPKTVQVPMSTAIKNNVPPVIINGHSLREGQAVTFLNVNSEHGLIKSIGGIIIGYSDVNEGGKRIVDILINREDGRTYTIDIVPGQMTLIESTKTPVVATSTVPATPPQTILKQKVSALMQKKETKQAEKAAPVLGAFIALVGLLIRKIPSRDVEIKPGKLRLGPSPNMSDYTHPRSLDAAIFENRMKKALKVYSAPAQNGGIDFDSKYLQMNMQGDEINMPVPKGFDWLLKTPISGFNPQILNIRSGIGIELSFFKGLLPQKHLDKPSF